MGFNEASVVEINLIPLVKSSDVVIEYPEVDSSEDAEVIEITSFTSTSALFLNSGNTIQNSASSVPVPGSVDVVGSCYQASTINGQTAAIGKKITVEASTG